MFNNKAMQIAIATSTVLFSLSLFILAIKWLGVSIKVMVQL